ncbi:MAG: aminotransferase class IV [Endomicrobiaceae bacterium]
MKKLKQKCKFTSENLSSGEYGLFETVKILNGKTIFLKEHYKRIKNSSTLFSVNMNIGFRKLINMANHIIEINKIKEGALKIVIEKDKVLISVNTRKYEAEKYKQGISLKISKLKKNEASLLLRHKTTKRLENILEMEKASKEGYDDSIFLNTSGYITETCIANIFFIKKDVIYTPSLYAGLLPGIIRDKVLYIAKQKNIKLEEGFFKKEELVNSESVFVTNSLMGIMPVSSVNGKNFCINHPILKDIFKIYNKITKL